MTRAIMIVLMLVVMGTMAHVTRGSTPDPNAPIHVEWRRADGRITWFDCYRDEPDWEAPTGWRVYLSYTDDWVHYRCQEAFTINTQPPPTKQQMIVQAKAVQ